MTSEEFYKKRRRDFRTISNGEKFRVQERYFLFWVTCSYGQLFEAEVPFCFSTKEEAEIQIRKWIEREYQNKRRWKVVDGD